MDDKIEQAQREFNAILDYVLQGAMDREIHQVEDRIYRMLLRLGRILLEFFVLSVGTGKMGQTLVGSDGVPTGMRVRLRGGICRFLANSRSCVHTMSGKVALDYFHWMLD